MDKSVLRCICGAVIDPSRDLIKSAEDGCYAIICPMERCRLKKIGTVIVSHRSSTKITIELSKMFIDWNILRLGKERCDRYIEDLKHRILKIVMDRKLTQE